MTETRPVVRIADGELRGAIEESVIGDSYASFKGIPYAKPPTGDLRFRDPEPPEPWTSTRDATKFGQRCAQVDLLTQSSIGSDDCLYLNVYAPVDFKSRISKPRAVMVFIHGGAFNHGDSSDAFYAADYIVAMDVVLVTVNYRLGILGFLNLEDEVATGNQGLKDQVLALKWVQKNIGNFGGDPKNVTIFGESAGAASVHYLTLSPMAEGLYHKAIAQSGVLINPWAHSAGNSKSYAKDVAAILGMETDDSKTLIEFFRIIDARKLSEAVFSLSTKLLFPGLFHFCPSDDSKSKNPFFPKPPSTAVRTGVKVPLLLGHTSHEGILFIGELNDEKFKIFDSRFGELLSPGVHKLIKEKKITPADLRNLYYGDKTISQDSIDNYVHLLSEVQFISGIHDVVDIQLATSPSPTYLYRFAYDSGQSKLKALLGVKMPGVCHGDDLNYLFYPRGLKHMGSDPAPQGTTTRLVMDRLLQMWTDFAKTGNPTPTVTDLVPVIWNPVKNSNDFEYLDITEDLKMKTVTNVNKRYAEKSKSNL